MLPSQQQRNGVEAGVAGSPSEKQSGMDRGNHEAPLPTIGKKPPSSAMGAGGVQSSQQLRTTDFQLRLGWPSGTSMADVAAWGVLRQWRLTQLSTRSVYTDPGMGQLFWPVF